MISISVNGESREVAEGSSLADLVALLVDSPHALATAVNGAFVPRTQRDVTVLQPGDTVLTFEAIVGG